MEQFLTFISGVAVVVAIAQLVVVILNAVFTWKHSKLFRAMDEYVKQIEDTVINMDSGVNSFTTEIQNEIETIKSKLPEKVEKVERQRLQS